MASELSEIVAELIQAVGFLREGESVEDGLVNLLGCPATDVAAAMQEHLQQTDDPGLVDLNSGITHRADDDRQSDSLQQREVHMDVEPLSLAGGEAVRDELELLAHRW